MHLRLELAHTRRAGRVETLLLLSLIEERCGAVGSTVHLQDERLVFDLSEGTTAPGSSER